MVTTATIPESQYAIQLVGPGQLTLNDNKPVFKPGPYQILARTECVGLCFSDLKLLKQFSEHARKSEVIEGLSRDILGEIPSYVPGDKPTVPGHEVTCRIIAVGEKVTQHKVGERCLVQTDYRDLPTASSNAAFGYNFEGGVAGIHPGRRTRGDRPQRRAVHDPRAGESQLPRPLPWLSRGRVLRIPTSIRSGNPSRPAANSPSSRIVESSRPESTSSPAQTSRPAS